MNNSPMPNSAKPLTEAELDRCEQLIRFPGRLDAAGTMPGTDGFTMAVFKASDVPVGSPLYASPPPAEPAEITLTTHEIHRGFNEPAEINEEPLENVFNDVASDGPYPPNAQRRWLARKLMDSRLTAEEAFSIAADYAPMVLPASTAQKGAGNASKAD